MSEGNTPRFSDEVIAQAMAAVRGNPARAENPNRAQEEKPIVSDNSPPARVTVYTSLGSKHIGGNTYPQGGQYYMQGTYNNGTSFSASPNGSITAPPKTGVITGNNGQFNRPFNEHNPGGSVNVMWPVAKTGEGVVEAGVTMGHYRNSFYRDTTYAAGSIAYRLPKALETSLGKTSVAVGAEVGRATGYPKKYAGQVYVEACQDITDKVALCAKLGAIPAAFEKAEPDKMTGTEHALKPGISGVAYDASGRPERYYTEKPIQTPIRKTYGVAATGQIGLSFRF